MSRRDEYDENEMYWSLYENTGKFQLRISTLSTGSMYAPIFCHFQVSIDVRPQ